MEFKKSERNQRVYEQHKLERQGKKSMRGKLVAPRFHPKTVIPEVSEGMELHKFYGEPVLLPARAEGEQMYGNSPFTLRQVETLQRLVAERNQAIEKETMRISIYE